MKNVGSNVRPLTKKACDTSLQVPLTKVICAITRLTMGRSMKSKVIVVTGASGGIGAAAARRLACAGHHVVVVGRLATKTAAVGQELNTEHFVADFTRLSDVQALARRLLETYPQIDVLAHNAGNFFSRERRVTVDGHEATFQVNHLASFLLTKLLLDRLISRGRR